MRAPFIDGHPGSLDRRDFVGRKPDMLSALAAERAPRPGEGSEGGVDRAPVPLAGNRHALRAPEGSVIDTERFVKGLRNLDRLAPSSPNPEANPS